MKQFFVIFILMSLLIACSDKTEVKKLSEQDFKKYSQKGKEIVNISAAVLKSNLVTAMKEGGVGNAIVFCSSKAQFLIDSLSKALAVPIKRTTFKVRNPNDKPDGIEIKALNTFKQMKEKSEGLHPILKQLNDKEMGYYYPILIDNPVCLNCHGTLGETLDSTIYKTIKEIYPNDNATGYKQGDLRGMWSLRIPIEK